jgi:hypothetical protein
MVHYLYHFDYDVRLQDEHRTNVNEPAGDALLTHAKIYALAEQYLISGLKAVALRQFKAAATVSLDMDDFLGAAVVVYESTIEDDRGLRDVVVETLCGHSEWLDEEKVRDVVKGLGALTYDTVKSGPPPFGHPTFRSLSIRRVVFQLYGCNLLQLS